MRNKNEFRNGMEKRKKNRKSINDAFIFINGVLMNEEEKRKRLIFHNHDSGKVYEHTINFKFDK